MPWRARTSYPCRGRHRRKVRYASRRKGRSRPAQQVFLLLMNVRIVEEDRVIDAEGEHRLHHVARARPRSMSAREP